MENYKLKDLKYIKVSSMFKYFSSSLPLDK